MPYLPFRRRIGVCLCGLALAALAAPVAAEALRTPLIAQSCAGCHGQQGHGIGSVPTIAGYDRANFLTVWEGFRSGAKQGTIMGRIARGYTDAEVAVLADYFSKR